MVSVPGNCVGVGVTVLERWAITIVIGAWVVAVVRVKMISHKVSFPFSIHFQKLTIVTLQAW